MITMVGASKPKLPLDYPSHPTDPARVKLYRFERLSREGTATVFLFKSIWNTPKGCWIRDMESNRRFVLTTPGRRRYAYLSKQEALNSFIQRKRRELLWIDYRQECFWPDAGRKYARLQERKDLIPEAIIDAMAQLQGEN